MTYTDLVTYFRARLSAEEGQTMAEYGVVLAVIAAIVVAALVALQGGITGAIDREASPQTTDSKAHRSPRVRPDAVWRHGRFPAFEQRCKRKHHGVAVRLATQV